MNEETKKAISDREEAIKQLQDEIDLLNGREELNDFAKGFFKQVRSDILLISILINGEEYMRSSDQKMNKLILAGAGRALEEEVFKLNGLARRKVQLSADMPTLIDITNRVKEYERNI